MQVSIAAPATASSLLVLGLPLWVLGGGGGGGVVLLGKGVGVEGLG